MTPLRLRMAAPWPETFLGPITRLDVRIADDTALVLVDLFCGTARTFAAGQEITLSVPPDAIRLYA